MPKKNAPAPAPAPTPVATDGGKIGKTQLVEMVAEQTSLSKKEAAAALDAIVGTITDALKSGKTVGLPGLGTMSVKTTAERQGVRPGTSEKITIPAGKKVGFKAASDLKTSLK